MTIDVFSTLVPKGMDCGLVEGLRMGREEFHLAYLIFFVWVGGTLLNKILSFIGLKINRDKSTMAR